MPKIDTNLCHHTAINNEENVRSFKQKTQQANVYTKHNLTKKTT